MKHSKAPSTEPEHLCRRTLDQTDYLRASRKRERGTVRALNSSGVSILVSRETGQLLLQHTKNTKDIANTDEKSRETGENRQEALVQYL